jgi:hypothetical protein
MPGIQPKENGRPRGPVNERERGSLRDEVLPWRDNPRERDLFRQLMAGRLLTALKASGERDPGHGDRKSEYRHGIPKL